MSVFHCSSRTVRRFLSATVQTIVWAREPVLLVADVAGEYHGRNASVKPTSGCAELRIKILALRDDCAD